MRGKIRIFMVYSTDIKETKVGLDRIIEGDKEKRLVIGGDFNATIRLK